MRSKRKQAAAAAAFLVAAGIGLARADTIINPSTEYLNRIKVGETVQPLGETPFGESVSLYTGAISFRQTDINFPGIGPNIVLTRTYEASGSPTTFGLDLAMADWDLAVPELTTAVPGQRMGYQGSWVVNTASGGTSDQRCSQFGPVSREPFAYGAAWWHGYQLVTGDGSSQPLLKRTSENSLAPSGNAPAYPVVTANHWMLSCLANTANGMPGEAFLALAPDGTRYWFNYLSYGAPLETLIESIPYMNNPDHPPGLTAGGESSAASTAAGEQSGDEDPNVYWGYDEEYMPRKSAHLYATRVEDRFGNWVNYSYSNGRLTEINASDGRRVLVTWRSDAPLVDSITLQPGQAHARIWRYEYYNPTNRELRQLAGVVLPDQRRWSMDMGWASSIRLPAPDPENPCYKRGFTQIPSDDNIVAIRMTHPTGLQGEFNLSMRAHARSWVPTQCAFMNGTLSAPSEHLPPVYLSLSLTSKRFSGPGVDPLTWTYRYSAAAGSTESECREAPCRDTQWVEATDPGGQTVHYTYSTRWGYLEGKLLSTVAAISQTGTDNPTGLQVETISYADPSRNWAYPSRLGQAMQDPISDSNTAPSERLSPELIHETTRQQVRFTREVLSFDQYGQPGSVRRSSSPGDSRTESTTYWPVEGQWVLGLPWKLSNGNRVIGQTDYDARGLPQRSYNFGQLVATYAYASNGMLATITDPLGNPTTLLDHKRGVPQIIRFADNSELAPLVDDFGQILSVRNQLGDRTSYAYDVMGRMTRLDFPSGDTVAWNSVLRDFNPVAAPEYGLPAGHWKQSVQTGNARVTTLYDALWRPRLTITEDSSAPGSASFVVSRFDDDGREVFRSYPVSSLTSVEQPLQGVRTSYDGLGRVTLTSEDSELGALNTTRQYLSGFRTQVTNPRGFQTTTTFQTFDTPSEDLPIRIEAPQGAVTTIQRDSYGKPLTITRSGPAG